MSLTLMEKFNFSASFNEAKVGPMEVLAERPTRCAFSKNGWYPLITTFHDDNGLEPSIDLNSLFTLLGHFYKFGEKLFANWKEIGEGWEKDVDKMLGQIELSDQDMGIGKKGDVWLFKKAWPHSINFGELCYSSDPSVDIEITWRFKECEEVPNV